MTQWHPRGYEVQLPESPGHRSFATPESLSSAIGRVWGVDVDWQDIWPSEPDPSRIQEQITRLRWALSRIAIPYRAIITGHERDLAEVLGVSQPSVSNRRASAIHHLTCLVRYEGDLDEDVAEVIRRYQWSRGSESSLPGTAPSWASTGMSRSHPVTTPPGHRPRGQSPESRSVVRLQRVDALSDPILARVSAFWSAVGTYQHIHGRPRIYVGPPEIHGAWARHDEALSTEAEKYLAAQVDSRLSRRYSLNTSAIGDEGHFQAPEEHHL